MMDKLKPIDLASDLEFDEVDEAIEWANHDAPRDECFMSTTSDSYTYGSGRGVRTYYPIKFSPLIDELRGLVKARCGIEYEVCFMNRYSDAWKHLGWHADDSPTIDHKYGIAIVSFGAEREIWFRKNGASASEVDKVLLPHGSLIMMPPGFQDTHQHRIPKCSYECGPRISLTWRKLKE